MDPFEERLKSLPLRQPSAEFGEPETLAAALRRAEERPSLIERIQNMSWKSKAAAILGLAASVAVAYLALSGATGGSVAFAQVAEKLRSAHTLTFDSVIKREVDGTILNKGRNRYMVPGKVRIEYDGEGGEQSYVVFDAPAGKMLFVDGKRKTARVSPLKRPEGNDIAAKTIEDVRSLAQEGARPLGDKQIDGVQAKGFAVDSDSETTTVWVDAASGEPIRVEILNKNYPGGPIVQVWTDIKLDQPVDPKLLSVEPPTGFKISQPLQVDVNATPAHYVADFLKIYARHMDDQFPQQLQTATKSLAEKLGPPKTDEPPSEEMMQLAFYGAAIAAATNHGIRGDRWQYYPGRKLGEADNIVFWFRDRKNGEYSAVFGDLRVEKVSPAQLPPAPREPPSNQ